MANGFCVKCGAPMAPGMQFCGGCGAPAAVAPPPPAYQQPYAPPPQVPQPYAPPPQVYAPPPAGYAPPPAAYGAPIAAGSKFPVGPIIALLLLGGGGFATYWFVFRAKGAGTTPEATFEAMRQAVIKEDGGALYDLVAPDIRKQMDAQLVTMRTQVQNDPSMRTQPDFPKDFDRMDGRAFFAWAMTLAMSKTSPEEKNKQKVEAQASTIEKTDITGDHATLTVKNSKGTDTIHMVKVDGKWYLSEIPN